MAANFNTNYGPIGTFLQKISNDWGLNFVFTKIWAVNFTRYNSSTGGNLCDNIKRIFAMYGDINELSKFVPTNTSLYYSLLDLDINSKEAVRVGSKAIHFALANKITIPQESMALNRSSLIPEDSRGGNLDARLGGARLNDVQRSVNITFLDTNKEFCDYIIKPWIVASAHRGLIESTELPNLKCDIDVTFFAKSSPDFKVSQVNFEKQYSVPNYPLTRKSAKEMDQKKWWGDEQPFTWKEEKIVRNVADPNEDEPCLRKHIIFHGCFPIDLPSKSYNYANEMGNDETMTTVKFSYEWYTVHDVAPEKGAKDADV